MNITSVITDYIRKSILTSDFDIPMLKAGVDTSFNLGGLQISNLLNNPDMLIPHKPEVVSTGTMTVDHVLSDGFVSPNSFKFTTTGTTAYETYRLPLTFVDTEGVLTLEAYLKGSPANTGTVCVGLFAYGDTNISCYSEQVLNDGEYHKVVCSVTLPDGLTDVRFSISAFHPDPSVAGDVFYLGYMNTHNTTVIHNTPDITHDITLRRPGVKVKHEQFNTSTSNYHVELGFSPSCVICLANQGEGTNESSSIGITDFDTTACHYITNNAAYQSSILGNFAYCEPDAVNNSVGYIVGADETGFIITVEHTGSQYVNMNFLALP